MGLPGFETGWAALGVCLLLLALVMLLKARQYQAATRLPEGEVIYSDMGTWLRQRRPLYDRDLGLTGRPDYLIEQDDGAIIPVEVKSGDAPPEPYAGHIMQLAAYCLLVQRVYGVRPPHGIIQYRDRAFTVMYGNQLENETLELLHAMRANGRARDVRRSHENWRRCHACGHKAHCGQALPAHGSWGKREADGVRGRVRIQ